MTRKILLPFLALMVIASVSFSTAETASAQYSCNYNCHYAYGIFLKNSNGTNFTGYVDIYSGGGQPVQYNKHFTNGVMDSGYIWSGNPPYSWNNIGLNIYTPGGGTWLGQGILDRRYSSVPFLPDVKTITFW